MKIFLSFSRNLPILWFKMRSHIEYLENLEKILWKIFWVFCHYEINLFSYHGITYTGWFEFLLSYHEEKMRYDHLKLENMFLNWLTPVLLKAKSYHCVRKVFLKVVLLCCCVVSLGDTIHTDQALYIHILNTLSLPTRVLVSILFIKGV